MRTSYSPKNNPRVIIIQKLYGKLFNDDEKLDFPKHRFKKFIKDIVFGTIERNELLTEELNEIEYIIKCIKKDNTGHLIFEGFNWEIIKYVVIPYFKTYENKTNRILLLEVCVAFIMKTIFYGKNQNYTKKLTKKLMKLGNEL